VRNRYLDLLRAVAIVRVVVYHLFGWPWLSIVLPAMGIMFALAGSLTAASMDKRSADIVVVSRLRRLLPPLWLLGLIAVPVMLALGWAHESDGTHPFSPARLLLWLLPVADPPGSDKGIDIWDPLWYVRAYLWFVVLSPALYAAYKRMGWVLVAAPIVAIAVLDKTGFSLPDAADAAMWDFVTFGACWIAGFAHHDGRLARTRPAMVLGAAAVLGGAALYWLRGHPGEDGYDLNDVAESQALWSLAFVLVVLRWQPPMEWLGRVRPLDRVVTLLNARAVTIYLWHNIAIDAVWPVLTVLALDDVGHLTDPVELATALAITGGAVLAFGWVEDLAARRRPRLLPLTAGPRPADSGMAIGGTDGHRADEPGNHAADGDPVPPGPAPIPWNAVTMPQPRTGLGAPPADRARLRDPRVGADSGGRIPEVRAGTDPLAGDLRGGFGPAAGIRGPEAADDLRGGSGSAARVPGWEAGGSPADDPQQPAHQGEDGGPATGRASAPVPWFGGDS
jgi:peptidoglycan/LPS O-acetylase OafA/YrhL